jgi:hypothetical protein
VTGWAFREIMEELPIAAGLQIINAEMMSRGVCRVWANSSSHFDSATVIDEAFKKLEKR